MTGPIASIIVSLILTLGALFGLGAFKPEKLTYATAKFDGGYQKIGVIAREEVYADATIELNGEKLRSGTVEEIIAYIEKTSNSDGDKIETVTWKAGVRLKADAGIKWTGSESNFKLTTESLDLKSTNQIPLKPLEVIAQLKDMREKAKAGRSESVKNALLFEKAPTESFLLSKILGAIGK
jgi:hypothetical protein